MNVTPITIDDRDAVEPVLRRHGTGLSDYTFTNMFMWRYTRKTHVAVEDDTVFFVVRYPKKPPYAMMPVGTMDAGQAIERLAEHFAQLDAPLVVRAIDKATAQSLESTFGDRFVFEPERDRFDYVYRVADLIELSGKHHKDKRNHLNAFRMQHDFALVTIDETMTDRVAGAQTEWIQKFDDEKREALEGEHGAILDLLEHFEQLNTQGVALQIGNRIAAFSFAEALADDTVVVHIEKADPDVRGAAQAINQQFLEQYWSEYTWVNREEDLGIPGLRRAKESYNPDHLGEKFVLRPADGANTPLDVY